MKIKRKWCLPNKNTFSIKPIYDLVDGMIDGVGDAIDPFCGNSPFKDQCVTNDLDPNIESDFTTDALVFLRATVSSSLVLFDPPYSPRQVSECYKKLDMTVNMQTTQSSFWGDMKKEISRIVPSGGHCITCGWNSGGIGKKHGFEIVEILLVAHGGWHNDTIVTTERRR